jgi:palmitoyltransferase
MARFTLSSLAVPSVCLLIIFLAYSSQYLFYYLDPGPLTSQESLLFNVLLGALWWCYALAVTVDPGRLPESFVRGIGEDDKDEATINEQQGVAGEGKKGRWCVKCKAVKPPRSHHCRQCARYAQSTALGS